MTEMALFIDHLSLAKEENKDILRLTQDSINRITQLSESVISLKDELLKARDTEIQALKKRLQSKNLTIRRLRQELEDLSMLASLPPVQSDAPKAR
jgi:chromosome segregation ATPase